MTKITRRDFLAATGAGLTLAGMGAFACAGDKAGKRPNLLIIHTDEHNFRTLGCYRKTLSKEQALMWGADAVCETPNIDWLAKHGAMATKFYAATPVCSPSRASFITGLYPQSTGVTNNDMPLNDDVVSFAEILHRAGYAAGYAGKWHLDGDGKPQWGPERKFGFEDNRYMFNRGHWKQFEDTAEGPRVKARNKNGAPTYDVNGADEGSFATDWLSRKAVDFMDKNRDQSFCYMLSIPDPHGPDSVRDPYARMYRDMKFEKARTYDKNAKDAPSWARPMKKASVDQSIYYGMVKCIDDNVGVILDYLRENNLLENTIVVFTSDHGDMRGEHRRENKSIPLEASAKVPFIVYYPKTIKAGTKVNSALGTADFLPTILGLMGVATTGKEEGRDASALFLGQAAPSGLKDITFSRATSRNDKWPDAKKWVAAFSSRYKLVLSTGDEPWLLDLEEDPDELRNFCKEPKYTKVVADMARQMITYGKKYNDQRVQNGVIAEQLKVLVKDV